MSYKTEFQSNNADLQAILNIINTLKGGSAVESTFVPTNSGGTTYKSKFRDNNVDLQSILNMVNMIPDYTALPVLGTSLADCTWEEISAVSAAGLGTTYFNIGDTKTITLNGTVGNTTFSNLSIEAFIIGIDHNADIEGSGITFQIGKINGVDVSLCDSKCGSYSSADGYFSMNPSGNNTGGWESSAMRTSIIPALITAFPEELQSALKPVTKYTDNTGGTSASSGYITATEDKVFLLAEFEVFGSRSSANYYEQNKQAQYEYYAAGNSRKRYKHDDATTTAYWWLRSTKYNESAKFCVVLTTGGINSDTAYCSHGLAPAFVI